MNKTRGWGKAPTTVSLLDGKAVVGSHRDDTGSEPTSNHVERFGSVEDSAYWCWLDGSTVFRPSPGFDDPASHRGAGGAVKRCLLDMSTTLPKAADHVEAELEQSNSSQLKRRVRKIYNAMVENDTVEQSMDIEVHYTDHDATTLTIEPEENWTNEGELGMDRFHIILGPRGGVRLAHERSVFTDPRKFEDDKHAFKRILSAIDGMA